MHSPLQERTRRLPGFSLIELLAIMAIISILLVAAVPIFSNSSNAARQASRELVKAHLQQARSHAVSTGRATAVAIPQMATTDLGARALGLFEVQKNQTTNEFEVAKALDASGNPTASDSPPIQRWETLPGNFSFIQAAEINAAASSSTLMDTTADLDTNFRQQISCHAIVFGPSGQIVYPVNNPPIRIAFAQTTRRGNQIVVTQNNDDQPIFEMLEVNRLTGRTREVRP